MVVQHEEKRLLSSHFDLNPASLTDPPNAAGKQDHYQPARVKLEELPGLVFAPGPALLLRPSH
jgi:hypothetical protein